MNPVILPLWLLEPLLVDVDAGRITVTEAKRRVAEYLEIEATAAVVEREEAGASGRGA